jgi:hypothetical protein
MLPRRVFRLVAPVALAAALAGPARAIDSGDPRAQAEAGHRLAEAVALVTGVPVSPLLGISGLGAWRWWTTPAPLRPALPWYSQPAFWGTGLLLALLFAANTTIGAVVPGLEKPMQIVEHHENLASALLASPIVLAEAHRLVAGDAGASAAAAAPHVAAAGAAALAGGEALPLVLRPLAALGAGALALLAFALVFLAFHAVQVLIALSPSALLDALLRLFRFGVLATAGAATALDPYLGALVGLFVLAVAALVAGWSFRLAVFGWVAAGEEAAEPRAPGAAGEAGGA